MCRIQCKIPFTLILTIWTLFSVEIASVAATEPQSASTSSEGLAIKTTQKASDVDNRDIQSTVVMAYAARENASTSAVCGDEIEVQVRGMGAWLYNLADIVASDTDLAQFKTKSGSSLIGEKVDPLVIQKWQEMVLQLTSHLCLYVNGVAFPELKAFRPYWDPAVNTPIDSTGCPQITLRFDFVKPDTSSLSSEEADVLNKRWNDLVHHIYSNTSAKNLFVGAKTDLTVGFDDSKYGSHYLSSALNPDYADPTNPTERERGLTFRVRPFSWSGMKWSIGIIASLIIAIIAFGFCTNLLRDPTLPARPAIAFRGATTAQPYSLAFCQIAFWTIVIVASYLFIYLSTGNYNCFNSTALTLLGISATTGLGAVVINNNDPSRATAWSSQMDTFYKKWLLISLFIDLLCERETMSFHRLQLITWTVVLAFVFVRSVFNTLGMPVLDPTLLILVGIVNGAYLGMKAA